MKIKVMQKTDKYAGPPICRLLLFIRSLFFFRKRLSSPGEPGACRNIVVIKFFGMGSLLLVSPVLGALKARYPRARVTMVTLASNRQLSRVLPSIDQSLFLDLSGFRVFFTSFFSMISGIRRVRPDIIIDLEFLTNFSALVTLLADFPRRTGIVVGFNSPIKWRNDVHTLNVSFGHSSHITGVFSKVARSLKADPEPLNFDAERKALAGVADFSLFDLPPFAGRPDFSSKKIVCVNVNAGELCFHRRWPADSFIRLIDALADKDDLQIVLIGAAADKKYVFALKQKLVSPDSVIDLSGKTGLSQLIALFVRSELLISNDSGPLHLAGVLGLKTVSFFGPETPALYGPPGRGHHVFYKDLYCSPCINIYNSKMSSCGNNLCLKSISTEEVLKVLEDTYGI